METINYETGEVFTEVSIEPEEPEALREAKKYLGLIEAFNISAEGMEENLIKEKERNLASVTPEHYKNPEIVSSIISTDELLDDFNTIRKNLKSNIKATAIILEKFGEDIASSHAEDISGSLLMGYSELVKSANSSMKLLMDSYSNVAETQLKVKKLITQVKDLEDGEEGGDTYNTQNIFVGSTADLLKKLKNS